jgi:hypothetical protein
VYRLAVLILLFVGCVPRHTAAQTNNRFAVGLDYIVRTSDRASTEDYAQGQLGPGLLWRFGNGKPGWGFHWGLNWYAVKIDRPIGGNVVELGELHVRPVMAGYGYTRVVRRTTVTAAVLGGYAFGSIAVEPQASDAYHTALGAQWATGRASNTFVLKPEIGAWYNLTRTIGLNVNAGYMIARPDVTMTTDIGIDKRTARADQFILRVGAVYSIF